MATTYEILVPGNSLEWSGGFLGFANLTLVITSEGTLLFDTGHYINRGALVAALAARDMVPGGVDKGHRTEFCGRVRLFKEAEER